MLTILESAAQSEERIAPIRPTAPDLSLRQAHGGLARPPRGASRSPFLRRNRPFETAKLGTGFVLSWALAEGRAMTEVRKLAAILVADVVGYSRLADADEERALARLRGLRSDLIDPAIAAHPGARLT